MFFCWGVIVAGEEEGGRKILEISVFVLVSRDVGDLS